MEVTVASNDGATWAEVPILAQTVTTGVCEALADFASYGAGGIDIGVNKTRALGAAPYTIWRIHKEFPKVIELEMFSSNHSSQNPGLRLVFEHELCPSANVALTQVLKASFAYDVSVLSVTGVLYCVSLMVSSSSKGRFSMQVTKTAARDVCDDLGALRKVTSLARSPGLFILGGQSGSPLCLAVGSGAETRPDHAFELKDGERGISRLLGFRGRAASPVKCLCAQLLSEAPLLYVVHEDDTLKVWDLQQRTRQFSQSISLPPELANPVIKLVTVEELPVVRDGVRVAFQAAGDPFAEMQGAAVVLYKLHTPQVDGGIRLTQLTLEQTLYIGQGEVLSCKILNDGVWVLQRGSEGQCTLSLAELGGTSVRKSNLMESFVAEQLFQGTGRSWDEFLFALHHTGLDSSSLEEVIPTFFLKRLLQPGVRQLAALKVVLQMRRRSLSDFEIGSLTLEGLRKEVKSSVKSEVGNARKTLQEWMKLCNSYMESWNHNCVPYELFADVSGGSVGLIRKNSVSVIRSLTPLELHDYRSPNFNTKDVGLPQDWEQVPGDSAAIGGLFNCMRIVTKHLGPMALEVFREALFRSPSYPLDGLVSSFMEVLDVGYTPLDFTQKSSAFGLDEIRVKVQSYHQRQRKFAFHISQALRALRESAGGWEVVLEVVYKYTQYLIFSTEAANPASTSQQFPLGCVRTKMLAQATRQISCKHFEAARDLLLLLSYMIKSRGQIGLSAIEVAKIQVTLVPQVQEGLAINLLLHWLSVTFAEAPPPEDYTLQLSSLRIDGSRGERAQPETLGAGEVTLGEILAAACLETTQVLETYHQDSLPSPDVLRNFAWRFVGWLLVGETAGACSLTFSKRAISLSSILLQHGQYGSLDSFLNAVEQYSVPQPLSDGIASVDGDWSARLHLLGICSLARAQTTLGPGIKEKHVGEAIQCFFRAASGTGEASRVLQTVFFLPQQQQIPQATTGVEESATWRLQYFEWVMQLFDQYNLSEGACQFAHAALEQVDEAMGMSPADDPNASSNMTIKGRLWANIFKFSLDLELYGNAYCAIISNPDEESKDICLKRYVIVLCDHRASQALCGNELPYGGMLTRVEEELVTKAHNSDVSVKSVLFKQLYALHMHHHNVGRAAGYMYEYAVTMRDLQRQAKSQQQSLSLLQEELDALAAAINALHLVESSEESVTSRIEWLSPAKRQKISADRSSNGQMIHSSGIYTHEKKSLDVEQLVKEHALALARFQLLKADSKTSSLGVNLPPSDVVQSLLHHGLYDMAFSLVFLCWKNSSQKQELEVVFEIMARRCCLLQLQMGSGSPSKPVEDFHLALTAAPDTTSKAVVSWGAPQEEARPQMQRQNGSDAKNCWQTLRDFIEKYWKLHPNIRAVVANTILSVDRQMELPLWLVNTFKHGVASRSSSTGNWEADPAALLRIYVDHERYVEAAYLLLEQLNAAARLRPSDVIKRKQPCAVWFPYTLVDRLLHSPSEFSRSDDPSGQYARLRTSLQNALAHHFELMKRESDDIRVIAGTDEVNGSWKGS